jgi:hypothetical protein
MRPILAVIGLREDTIVPRRNRAPGLVVPGKPQCCQQSARPSKQSDVSLEGPLKGKSILILRTGPRFLVAHLSSA